MKVGGRKDLVQHAYLGSCFGLCDEGSVWD